MNDMTLPAPMHRSFSGLSDSATAKGTPAASGPANTPLLAKLAQQPQEVIDSCLSALKGADRAHLGLALMSSGHGSPSTLKGMNQPLMRSVAANTRRSLKSDVAPGPLHQSIWQGLDTLKGQPPTSSHWITVNAERLKQNRALSALKKQLAAAHETAAQGPLFEGQVAAIAALDRLALEAPHPGVWHLHEQRRRPQVDTNKALRRAGRDALLLTSYFSSAMQHTPLAKLAVGTALAFMGRHEAAERVFETWMTEDLIQAVRKGSGDDGLHLEQLLTDPTCLPDRCLLWLKSAALAADAPSLYAVMLRALRCVPSIEHKWPAPPDLNRRWAVLTCQPSFKQLDYDWAHAMGKERMRLFIEAFHDQPIIISL